jgi:hypothetical protein
MHYVKIFHVLHADSYTRHRKQNWRIFCFCSHDNLRYNSSRLTYTNTVSTFAKVINIKSYWSRGHCSRMKHSACYLRLSLKWVAKESSFLGRYAVPTLLGLIGPDEGTTIPPKLAPIYQSTLLISQKTNLQFRVLSSSSVKFCYKRNMYLCRLGL